MLHLEYKNHLITCPMCLGKGYCNEDKSKFLFGFGKPASVSAKCSLRLPNINFENKNFGRRSSSHGSEFPTIEGSTGDVHLPIVLPSKTNFNKKSMAYPGGDNSKIQEYRPLPVPFKYERPQDVLKLALLKLKQNQWESTVQALMKIAEMSRYHPEMIDPNMPIINRSICSLLKNIRSNIVKTACQVAKEMFLTMQCTQRPEFDELVGMLLQKTADTNMLIRQNANSALDAMVDSVSSSHCVRVLSSTWGAGHKNPSVRATVSRLLNYIVTITGVTTLLSASVAKDTRTRIFATSARFLVDSNSETRGYARTLIKLLMGHDNFENQFNREVDHKLIEKVKKELMALKYSTPSNSHMK
ncbi:uncharacterized protein LOC105687194 [Athalia rosae]|uniref:uncharacterized protein LOC105687194 n=1 Tax=Athalia rosae TaxID=37344 RepID=UPI0020345004|nr:uncharacterized protein LOC105687194 [Athalia rosae]